MQNILEKIIEQKKIDLALIKKKNSLYNIEEKIKFTNNYLDFKKTLIDQDLQSHASLIAEIKKASPSAGIIVKNFDYMKIADLYSNNGATCLSVLTEERFFLGNLTFIEEIKIIKKIEGLKVIEQEGSKESSYISYFIFIYECYTPP